MTGKCGRPPARLARLFSDMVGHAAFMNIINARRHATRFIHIWFFLCVWCRQAISCSLNLTRSRSPMSHHVSSDDSHLVGGVRMSILYPIARLRFTSAIFRRARMCLCDNTLAQKTTKRNGMSWMRTCTHNPTHSHSHAQKINNMSSGFCVAAAAAATGRRMMGELVFLLMMFAIHLFGRRIQ